MNRISVVEVMRALAAISVALFHFCNQLHSAGARWVANYGWLGVDVFFVISGFVIPWSLYNRGYRLHEFPSFMIRRFVRLEPAYLVSVAAVIVLLHASNMVPQFRGPPPNYSLPQLASHLFYIAPLVRYQWLNPVYWSLSYELVFYITVGLTFSYIIRKEVIVTIIFATGALILSFAIFNMIDVHILEFLVGALVMRLLASDTKAVENGVWLLASLVFVFGVGGVPTGVAVSLAASGIVLLRSVEFGRWAVFFGGISYSLYLVHVPIGGRIVNLAMRFGAGGWFEILVVLLAFSASVVAAIALRRFVEAPAVIFSRKIGRRRLPDHAYAVRPDDARSVG